jgi:hypothetical protein
MAHIVGQVEQHYGGALERLQRKWMHDTRLPQQQARADTPAQPAAKSPPTPPAMSPGDDRFGEILVIELNAWLHGIKSYPGEPFVGLLHRAVKELGLTFREAVRHGVVFEIADVARHLALKARFTAPEAEIAAAVCGQLPRAERLNEGERRVLYEVLRRAERAYPAGAFATHLKRVWDDQDRQYTRDRAELDALPEPRSGDERA